MNGEIHSVLGRLSGFGPSVQVRYRWAPVPWAPFAHDEWSRLGSGRIGPYWVNVGLPVAERLS